MQASTEVLKRRKTASRAVALSFARCWLRAEAEGACVSMPKKSISSVRVEEAPWETRKRSRVAAGSFFCAGQVFSGWNVNPDMPEATLETAELKRALILL